MKKQATLLTIILSIISIFAHAQFFQEGVKWTEYELDFCDISNPKDCLTTIEYKIKGDTIINELNYKKLYMNDMALYAVRETTDSIVYLYCNELNLEILWFDFSWRKGEKIILQKVVFNKDNNQYESLDYEYTINDIDTMLLENGEKKTYTYSLGPYRECIHGIGFLQGLTYYFNPIPTCLEDFGILNFYDKNGVLLYKNTVYGCDFENNVAFLQNQFSLSPNPAKTEIFVEFYQPSNVVKIYSMQGALMLEQIVGNSATINVSQFPTGTYVIVVNGNDSKTFVKE